MRRSGWSQRGGIGGGSRRRHRRRSGGRTWRRVSILVYLHEGDQLEAAPQVSPYEEQGVSGWGARLMFGSEGSLVLRSQMLAGGSVSPVGRGRLTAVIGRFCTTSITATGKTERPYEIVNLFNDSTGKLVLFF